MSHTRTVVSSEPETQGGVVVRGEADGSNRAGVRGELAEDGSRAHVEELDPSLLAADGERLAVVAEDAAVGDILKAGEGSRGAAALRAEDGDARGGGDRELMRVRVREVHRGDLGHLVHQAGGLVCAPVAPSAVSRMVLGA